MSSPPRGCMAMIPPCRCWHGAKPMSRSWVYVRDDRPFGGPAPPAAVFYYSRDRGGEHPQAHLAEYAGILQADAYGGYGKLYEANPQPGPILEAACWVHARRKFFVLADLAANARRKAQGKTGQRDLAAGAGGGPSHRRAVRYRARHQRPAGNGVWRFARNSARRSSSISKLDARGTRQAVAPATTSPRRWITCSSAGKRLPASSTTGGFA